jgi:hypothetical protein
MRNEKLSKGGKYNKIVIITLCKSGFYLFE